MREIFLFYLTWNHFKAKRTALEEQWWDDIAMPSRKRRRKRSGTGSASVQQQPKNGGNGQKRNNNGKLVAVNFKKGGKRWKNPMLHLKSVEARLEKYLYYMKKELSAEQYIMVLEALVSAAHNRRVTEKVLIKHLKIVRDIT
jgi:hypothetical protein